jgi:nitrogenase-associated protein
MSYVIFFEKPGCINNTRQKDLLETAGHRLVVRDLLSEPWTAAALRPFFGDMPVADWFNRAAPAVKDGRVVPASLDETQALALMLADPLLIRRPLMRVGGERMAGFDGERVDAWIGLAGLPEREVEACPRTHAATPCPTP